MNFTQLFILLFQRIKTRSAVRSSNANINNVKSEKRLVDKRRTFAVIRGKLDYELQSYTIDLSNRVRSFVFVRMCKCFP